jgi:glycosyltransferase involved in cell wall biosynthesis
MRILTIAATPFFSDRGCHMRVYNEAKYLQASGAEVVVCTYHLGKDIDGMRIRRIANVGWYRKKTPGFSWGKVWLDWKLFLLCKKELKKFQPEIIHAHLFEGLAIGWLAKLLLGMKIPIVLDMQGDLRSEFKSYNKKNILARKVFVLVSQWLIKKADFVVTSSDHALKALQKIYPDKQALAVIPDGVDIAFFSDLKSEADFQETELIKKIKKWQKKDRILIYTGTIDESKGISEALTAFIEALGRGLAGWKLLVVGYGKALKKCKIQVASAKLTNEVYFTGGSSYFDLPDLLRLADAAIDPKHDTTEASGKLINYMAAGLPVIAFENRFNRSFLARKGFLIKKLDGDSLAENLRRIETFTKPMQYDLQSYDEAVYVRKLEKIFKLQIKKDPSGIINT